MCGGQSADSGKDGTGGVCRTQTPVPFVMLRSWDLNVVKIQRERIKGWSEGCMCRWGLRRMKLSPPPLALFSVS